jgi:hypothetical protein
MRHFPIRSPRRLISSLYTPQWLLPDQGYAAQTGRPILVNTDSVTWVGPLIVRADKRSIKHVPEISRFLGIVIYILYDDHRPPHFHAEYGEFKVSVEINTGIVQGRFPRRALKSLLEWYELYRDQLLADWQLAEQHQPLNRIPPLE